MSAQHTPGPWQIEIIDGDPYVSRGSRLIAHVQTQEDDARLIAAAPELLAALQEIEQLITSEDSGSGWHLKVANMGKDTAERVRSAIAKAEGHSARNLPARNELERESGRRNGE